MLLRNLCDALVPCATTSEWIQTFTSMNWPFEYHSLDTWGHLAPPDRACDARCSKVHGLFDHVRFPRRDAFEAMLRFLASHPLP